MAHVSFEQLFSWSISFYFKIRDFLTPFIVSNLEITYWLKIIIAHFWQQNSKLEVCTSKAVLCGFHNVVVRVREGSWLHRIEHCYWKYFLFLEIAPVFGNLNEWFAHRFTHRVRHSGYIFGNIYVHCTSYQVWFLPSDWSTVTFHQ